jgi:hypothetical protein
MKIPVWFKIAWWCVLTTAAGVLFSIVSLPPLLAGEYAGVDVLLLGVWLLLLLMPLVGEFNFLGIGFKRELEEIKQEMKSQLLTLRADIQNSASVTSHISPQFFLGAQPLSDQELDQRKKQAGLLLREESQSKHAKAKMAGAPAREATLAVPQANQQLFAFRFELEAQLKRIALEKGLATERSLRQMRGQQIAAWLRDDGILSEKLYPILRDVYGICSMGVHAVEVTAKQEDFIRQVAPGLIAVLRRL